MVLVVVRRPHKRHSVGLSTVVKATVAFVEFVAVQPVDRAVQHQHLMLSSDSENEIVAAREKKEQEKKLSQLNFGGELVGVIRKCDFWHCHNEFRAIYHKIITKQKRLCLKKLLVCNENFNNNCRKFS